MTRAKEKEVSCQTQVITQKCQWLAKRLGRHARPLVTFFEPHGGILVLLSSSSWTTPRIGCSLVVWNATHGLCYTLDYNAAVHLASGLKSDLGSRHAPKLYHEYSLGENLKTNHHQASMFEGGVADGDTRCTQNPRKQAIHVGYKFPSDVAQFMWGKDGQTRSDRGLIGQLIWVGQKVVLRQRISTGQATPWCGCGELSVKGIRESQVINSNKPPWRPLAFPSSLCTLFAR